MSRLRKDQPGAGAVHVVPRGWASPSLLAMIVFEEFGQHQPLNRQADRYALEGAPIALSTMVDAVGAVSTALDPLRRLIEAHVMAAERLHGDDTTVPVLTKGKTDTGRLWIFVRDVGHSAAPGRRRRSSTTHGTGAASIRRRISRAMSAFCRRTPMTATTSSISRTASRSDPGGGVFGAFPPPILRHGRHRGERAPLAVVK